MAAAHGALARVSMVEGRLAEAREQAEKALGALQYNRGWRPLIYRTLIEVLLREGHLDAAHTVADKGLRCVESFGDRAGHAEVPLRLAIAEARAAAGNMDAAREVLAKTLDAIEARAATIPDLAMRAHYLDQVPEHV